MIVVGVGLAALSVDWGTWDEMRVASAQDIELSMTRGVNYPKGLLAWGDEIGAAEILRRLDDLQAEYGEDRYRPSPLLRRRVRAGEALLS